MDYPIFEVPRMGGGMMIGLIATVHVLVAHFAVGIGFFLPIAETAGRRTGNKVLIDFCRRISFVLLLSAIVFGAVTGVGIWFSIALVHPQGTSALIHNFVWGWATEWVMFLVEIVAAYVYYYTWDKLSPGKHIAVGWIYAISAWMSLVLISGILSFMLTPGDWPAQVAEYGAGNFWAAFFNAGFLPTVIMRTISGLAFAGLVSCVVVNCFGTWAREQKTNVINFASYFMLPLVLSVPAGLWYLYVSPPEAREMPLGGAPVLMLMFVMATLFAPGLVSIYAYLGLIIKKRYINLETSLLLLLIAAAGVGTGEFLREGMRRPYLLYDYMYSNGVRVSEAGALAESSVLKRAPWVAPADWDQHSLEQIGEWTFEAQCMSCHTKDGALELGPWVKNWPRELIEYNLRYLNEFKSYMPPVFGTEQEFEGLVEYVWQMGQKAHHQDQTQPAEY